MNIQERVRLLPRVMIFGPDFLFLQDTIGRNGLLVKLVMKEVWVQGQGFSQRGPRSTLSDDRRPLDIYTTDYRRYRSAAEQSNTIIISTPTMKQDPYEDLLRKTGTA